MKMTFGALCIVSTAVSIPLLVYYQNISWLTALLIFIAFYGGGTYLLKKGVK